MADIRRYGFYYATIELNNGGECTGVQDTTDFILDPTYVPIPEYSRDYLFKYYYPIPETVTSFDDFNGKWYYDSEHQNEATELNN